VIPAPVKSVKSKAYVAKTVWAIRIFYAVRAEGNHFYFLHAYDRENVTLSSGIFYYPSASLALKTFKRFCKQERYNHHVIPTEAKLIRYDYTEEITDLPVPNGKT
jgi:hypothetical protein